MTGGKWMADYQGTRCRDLAGNAQARTAVPIALLAAASFISSGI